MKKYQEGIKTEQEDLNEIEEKILKFCKTAKSIKEIMGYIKYKNRRTFTLLYLRPLLEKGLLEMTIPEKPTSKNQKYISKI